MLKNGFGEGAVAEVWPDWHGWLDEQWACMYVCGVSTICRLAVIAHGKGIAGHDDKIVDSHRLGFTGGSSTRATTRRLLEWCVDTYRGAGV